MSITRTRELAGTQGQRQRQSKKQHWRRLSSGRRQQARRPAQQSRNAPKHDSSGTPACGVRTQQDDGVRSSGRQRVGTSRHTLTQLSPPECLDLHNWHESHHKVHRKQGTHLPSAKVLVKRNTSPAPAASPFRPNPLKAVGAKRQCQTPSGALTPHPGSLASPDSGRK